MPQRSGPPPRPEGRRWTLVALLGACGGAPPAAGALLAGGPQALTPSGPPSRYIFVSSPSMGNVYYSQLPSFHDLTLPSAKRPAVEATVLIDGKASKCEGWGCPEDADEGLREPRALALHQQASGAGTLYVADSQAAAIFSYRIWMNDIGISVGPQRRVLTSLSYSVGAMALDSLGNLFFSEEAWGRRHPHARRLGGREGRQGGGGRVLRGGRLGEGPSRARRRQLLLGGCCGGLWPKGDTSSGIVARAPERRAQGSNASVEVLAANSDLYQEIAVNVCLARDNLFFTGESEYLFAVKISGGMIANVSRAFSAPKGCAYDGESTLYVADAGSNAVYSLPANMAALRPVRHTTKVVSVEGPDQIAIFHTVGDGLLDQTTGAIHAAGAAPWGPRAAAAAASLAAAAACCA
ncbi:unnamed protein product [Prorocentrum cordatum]|uniref:Uncharacterized protein n=1 Tax=Prorocentrum cordatum TaxID=2364126 RepID=A0ABN9VLP3_9DINO|nr:unnamed protein product [Polarella glacialis]